jgi:hypothetical protein
MNHKRCSPFALAIPAFDPDSTICPAAYHLYIQIQTRASIHSFITKALIHKTIATKPQSNSITTPSHPLSTPQQLRPSITA